MKEIMTINESLLEKIIICYKLSNYEIDLFKLAYAVGIPMSEAIEDILKERYINQIKTQEAANNDL